MSEATLTLGINSKGIVVSRAEVDKLVKSLGLLGEQTEKVKEKSEKMSNSWVKNASQIKTLGRDMSRYFTLPLLAAGAASLKFANDLNSGLGNVQTLIPNTASRIFELKGNIMDLAAETGKSFEDLNNGLYRTISVFQDNVDTVERLNVAVKAGIAGYATTEEAVALLSAVTRAYGDTSAEAVQKVSDLAFEAVRLGDTTFPALAGAMQVATDRADRLNISQEELFASFATLTGITGDASMVATQFRSAMDSLLKPTKELSVLFAKEGAEGAEDFIKKMGGLGNAMKRVVQYSDQSGVALLRLITRKEGATFASRIATSQFADFNKKLDAMHESAGASGEAFKAASEGVNKYGFQIKQATAKMKNAAVTMGDQLQPAWASFLHGVATLFTALTSTNPLLSSLTLSLVSIVAVLGPLTIAIGAVLHIIKTFKTIGFVAFLATGPGMIIAVTAALVALGVAVANIAMNWEKIKWDSIRKDLISSAKGYDAATVGMWKASEAAKKLKGNLSYDDVKMFLSIKKEVPEIVKYLNWVDTEGQLVALTFEKVKTALDSIQISKANEEFADQLKDGSKFIKEYAKDLNKLADMRAKVAPDIQGMAEIGVVWEPDGDPVSLLEERSKKSSAALNKYLDEMNGVFNVRGFEMYHNGKEMLLRIKQGLQDGVDDTLGNGLGPDAGGEGGKTLKRWYDWFEELGDIPKSRFAKIVNGKTVGYLGTEAANQFVDAMEQTMFDADFLTTALGKPITLDIRADQADEAIQKLKNLYTALMATKPEETAPGDTFKIWDNSIQGIIQAISMFESMSGAFKGHSFSEDLIRIDGDIASGSISALEGVSLQLERMRDRRQEIIDQDPLASTAEIDAMIKSQEAIELWKTTIDDLQTSIRDLAVGELNGLANEVGQAFGYAADSIDDMGDALANYVAKLADALPAMFISAGLNLLIADHRDAKGWMLMGMGLSGSFINGIRQGTAAKNEEKDSQAFEANAKGNIFNSAGMKAFANGGAFTNSIVSSPTLFPFANGVGLMGEKKPEAIMPLTRTPSGELGVRATGGGGTTVNIKVENKAGDVATATASTDANGDINIVVEKIVNNNLMRGAHDKAMTHRYDTAVRGRRSA